MTDQTGSSQVLVVDPDPDTQQLLADALSGDGCVVVGLDNARASFDVAMAKRPALIVLSADIPHGIATCNRIKQEEALAAIPVILTSGGERWDALHLHRFLPTRADAYVLKPLTPDVIETRVRRFLTQAAAPQPLKPIPARPPEKRSPAPPADPAVGADPLVETDFWEMIEGLQTEVADLRRKLISRDRQLLQDRQRASGAEEEKERVRLRQQERITELRDEVQKSLAGLAERDREITALHERIRRRAAAELEMQSSLRAAQEALNHDRDLMKDRTHEVAKLREELHRLRTTDQTVHQRVTALEAERDRLADELATTAAEVQALEAHGTQATEEMLARHRLVLATVRGRVEEAHLKASGMRQHILEQTERIGELEAVVLTRDEELATTADALRLHEAALAERTVTLESAKDRLKITGERLAVTEEQLEERGELLAATAAKAQQEQAEALSRLEAALDAERAAVAEAQARLRALEAENTELVEATDEGAQALEALTAALEAEEAGRRAVEVFF